MSHDEAFERGDSILVGATRRRAAASDFHHSDDAPAPVILIHGFTANGSYLAPLADGIAQHHPTETFSRPVFVADYHSYRGIGAAAESLTDILVLLDRAAGGRVLHNGVFLVAHSMGGLVARTIALQSELAGKVRGLAMLGTPNGGLLDDVRMAGYLMTAGEAFAGADPRRPHVACKSARELVLKEPFIAELNARWKTHGHSVPTITISGGRRWLRFGRSWLRNIIANHTIQKALGGQANDGLVPEDSVNLKTLGVATDTYEHINDYPFYPDLNHSNLIRNQEVELRVANWLNSLDPLPRMIIRFS